MLLHVLRQVPAGLAASLAVALAAYWKRSLAFSGVVAAVCIGTLLFVFGSLSWYGSLLAFFISSSLLSKWKPHSKNELEDLYQKTGRRDAGQVLANGGLPTLVCIAHFFWPDPYWWPLYLGLLATVNADTWATEIGTAFKGTPRSIRSLRKVPPGTSGGITMAGCLAAAGGGLFIGLAGAGLAALLGDEATLPIQVLLLIGACGFAGSLLDSLLGSTWQALYKCKVCGRAMERDCHHNEPCQLIRGSRLITNDVVNGISALAGGLLTLFLAWNWLG